MKETDFPSGMQLKFGPDLIKYQTYSQAAKFPFPPPAHGIAVASNGKQSSTWPDGTVAFSIAAKTCHIIFVLPGLPLGAGTETVTGHAMNPSAPKPVNVYVPVVALPAAGSAGGATAAGPGVYVNGPNAAPEGIVSTCAGVNLSSPVGRT